MTQDLKLRLVNGALSHLLADALRATLAVPMTEWFNSPALRIYGGAIAWIADVCLSGAVQTVVPPRTSFAPLDLKVHFVRPVSARESHSSTARRRAPFRREIR